jgi:hypothetical protein
VILWGILYRCVLSLFLFAMCRYRVVDCVATASRETRRPVPATLLLRGKYIFDVDK